MKNVTVIFILLSLCLSACSGPEFETVKIKIIETSDVHGNYFSYDFVNQKAWEGGLVRVSHFVDSVRQQYNDNLLLFDNGDILQGQLSVYYYNFIDTVSPHLGAEVMNFMNYDLGNMGNHDLEMGHSAYDRWVKQSGFPVLGANIIDESTGKPYFEPYAVFVRNGVKIAVLGMITPAVPTWLLGNLWSGLSFEDMEECARKWMKVIREKENPDIVIGLFHAGKEARTLLDKYRDDASVEVAQRVPGFDAVLIGHDHSLYCEKVLNVDGDSVLVVNPGYDALFVGNIDITVVLKDGKVDRKHITGQLTDIKASPISDKLVENYTDEYNDIQAYASEKIGEFTKSVTTREAYFGPSGFIDFIHQVQLYATQADVSFAAPLIFDQSIEKGDFLIADMFKLYRFRNFLYTMQLSGKEIKNFLEESYAIWTNQMVSPDDNLLLFRKEEGVQRRYFANYYFLFDSAAGIEYTVDVTKPKGEKITILRMAGGNAFSPDSIYNVALTSFRGSGGGGSLARALDVPPDRLKERVVAVTEKEFRYYMTNYMREKGIITPDPLNQWKFIPEEWTKPAAARDYIHLFGYRE